MKYNLQINQLAIIKNGFNIKGTSLDTWALLDFLVFFHGAKNHRTFIKDGVSYVWVNYNYIQSNLPLCNLYKQSIKKHLALLQEIGLIALIKDESNNVYFKFKELIERLFINKENFTHLSKILPTPKENFTHPLSKILPSTININNQESKNNENLKEKEKNTKKEKDQAQKDFCPKGQGIFSYDLENDFSESENISLFKPETSQKSILELEAIQRELERLKIENNALKSQISENHAEEKESELKNEFAQIWTLYPNKQGKQIAYTAYKKARNGNKKQGLAPVSFEAILRGLRNYINANKGVEIKYIKHLSTFLNQQTFADFQSENNLNRRVGVVDNNADYMNTDKSKYIPK